MDVLELKKALAVLAEHGLQVVSPSAPRAFSLRTVATQLDVSVDWVREHLEEFPGRRRLPGGGKNGGEWRIPARDVERFLSREQ